jgi:hypothetical protein
MGRLFILWLFIAATQNQLRASHVLGGEITYKRISGTAYQFQLTVYRNCTECEFNTLNCPSIPDLDVLGAPGTLKAGQKLGTVALSRVNRRDISPLCNSVSSACGSNPGINLGIEAWVFTGSFDFSALLSVQCGFHVSVRIDSRTDAWGTAEYFYNYASINLCNSISNNSPQLNAAAFFILPENEPFRYNPLAVDTDGDSLSYRLVPAQKGYERDLLYPTGITPLKPLTVYCGSGGGCPDNPAVNPPTGLTFDSLCGDLTFTPLSAGTRGFMVLEVQEWRKVGAAMIQIGCIRRDLQFLVLSVKNATPGLKISGATEWLCAGEESCFEVYGSDPAFLGVKDSLKLEVDGDFTGFYFKINSAKAGSSDASFCWTPQSAHVRDLPYRLTFSARDQACPLNLYTYSSLRFRVAEKVKASMTLKLDTCATLIASGTASPSNSAHQFNWYLFDDKMNLKNQELGPQVRFRLAQGGKYFLRLELKNAVTSCITVAEDSIYVPTFSRPELSLDYPQNLCPSAFGTASAIVTGGTLPLRYFWDNVPGDSVFGLRMPSSAAQGLLIQVRLQDQIGCTSKGMVRINPFPFPGIHFRDTAICSSSAALPLKLLIANRDAPLSFRLLEGKAILSKLWPNTILEHQGKAGRNIILASYVDVYGCQRLDTSVVTVTELPNDGIIAPAPLCEGVTMLDLRRETGLRLIGGSWFLDESEIQGDTLHTSSLSAGTYPLRYIWRGGGCEIERRVELRINSLPVVRLDSSLPSALCANRIQSVKLRAIPMGGTWFGPQVSGSLMTLPASSGQYKAVYYYQDAATGCADTAQFRVSTFLPPAFTELNGYKSELCAGESLEIQVVGAHVSRFTYETDEEDGLSYTQGDRTRFSPYRSSGWASVRIVAQAEQVCPDRDTILQVLVKALPTARVSSSAWSGCTPFEAELQLHDFYPGKPDACFWQPNQYISSLGDNRYRFSGAGAGTHALYLNLQRSGCSNTILIPDSFRVFATPQAAFDVSPGSVVDWEYPTISFLNRTYCPDSVASVWYFQGNYGWQMKTASPVVNFPAPGVYDVRLRAVSEHGCTNEAYKQVRVNPPLRFFVPDAFTPDDKLPQENNEFKVSIAETVADYSLQVFNRWGQKVFETDRPESGWNGRTPDGIVSPVGTYAWSLRFRTASGREVTQQGTVLLLR